MIWALAGLESGGGHLSEFRAILDRLDRLPHVFDYVRPEGAYYVFPKVLVPHDTSERFAKCLLAETRVTLTPGSAFGPSGEHHVRMAYYVDDDTINLAFDRLETRFGV